MGRNDYDPRRATGMDDVSKMGQAALFASMDPAITARLQQVLGDIEDIALLGEIIAAFLEGALQQLTALRQAAETGDAQGVSHAAHTLKGSSGNLGAQGMAQLCQTLEALGAAGAVREAASLIARLEAEFQRVQPTLEHAARHAG